LQLATLNIHSDKHFLGNWAHHLPLLGVTFLNQLWNSKGKTIVLLWCEVEDVVRIKISTEPYKDYYSKHCKARTVFHRRKEGDQKNPED
jgi:hypothetical protein